MPDSSHNGPPPALCLTPAFGELLAGFDLDALARQPDTIIGLDADLRLAFLNPAWFAFAVSTSVVSALGATHARCKSRDPPFGIDCVEMQFTGPDSVDALQSHPDGAEHNTPGGSVIVTRAAFAASAPLFFTVRS